MLLIHQTGSVRVGEVVRYTLTYTPSADRILPPPSQLHVKIRNTSAIPLRAAYLHGPYTLYVATYPSTFDPNQRHVKHKQEGSPDFEPNLKAGGHWTSKLTVPEDVRQSAGEYGTRHTRDADPPNFTWIIEIASQVLFSTTAAVHFELLIGRDEKSVDLGFHGVVGSGHGAPGRLEDHQQGRKHNAAHPKGVFSKAVRLAVDDTESLWNTPAFPEWDDDGKATTEQGAEHGDKRDADAKDDKKSKKRQKIHLVLVTHGLHSNLGADMLFVKESIDSAATQAREDARQRRAEMQRQRAEEQNQFGRDVTDQKTKSTPEIAVAPVEPLQDEEDDDDEQVMVRGFNGNAVRTERGIQYLGKRFAKFVLSLTYPDQPYLPVKSSISKSITRTFTGQKPSEPHHKPAHKNSSIVKDVEHTNHNLAYQITSISFVGHSLGGLIQTYAIAYIQKHSPEFFDRIKPVNFIAMASPFLGLSNENPMYVKFALDFGLVGRTGQDLGLTWRTPTIARSGWDAVIGGLGQDARKVQGQEDPGAKPLLRILPTGPAHSALKKFRNRSLYSNVVNDGIVPLRTSCLLFLDWRGLGRVEKARRENGLVGTMVGWGWAEMTGQNASTSKRPLWNDFFGDSGDERSETGRQDSPDPGNEVPQADAGESLDDDNRSIIDRKQTLDGKPYQDEVYDHDQAKQSENQPSSPWAGLMSFFRPQGVTKAHHHPPKPKRIYERGQTTRLSSEEDNSAQDDHEDAAKGGGRKGLVRGASLFTNSSENGGLEAPPKTTFFESAGDILKPPIPPKEFIMDPAARPRTIFHDRVYHPEDIPPPPLKRRRSLMKRPGSRDGTVLKQGSSDMDATAKKFAEPVEPGAMKIEERIARAYHKDLTWRKVLVRLEPDAHNNMIVRRMFANAYGWPVVKHLCDTHFAYTAAAQMKDEDETAMERAEPADERVGAEGEQVKGQVDPPEEDDGTSKQEDGKSKSLDDVNTSKDQKINPQVLQQNLQKLNIKSRSSHRTESEIRESSDQVPDLVSPTTATTTGQTSYSSTRSGKAALSRLPRDSSGRWSDRFFEGSDDDSDDEECMKEWRKAEARGKAGAVPSNPLLDEEARTKIVDEPLTASPSASAIDLRNIAAQQAANKDRFNPSKYSPSVHSQTTNDTAEEEAPGRNLTELGLRKSIEERVASDDNTSAASLGVAEHVAFATSKKE